MAELISTHDLVGRRVIGGKNNAQRIGKVRCCIFHPTENRCVGFLVKRPDVALMFHRKDHFVTLDGYERAGDALLVSEDDRAARRAASRAGIDPEGCIVWSGLPVMSRKGEKFGHVGAVVFDAETGEVESVVVSQGLAGNAVLGTVRVPAPMIGGFVLGMGEPLFARGEVDDDETADPRTLGALLVSGKVAGLQPMGGAAEQAGRAAAVAADKAHGTIEAAKPKVEAAKAAAKPKLEEGAAKAGEAVSKGAFAAGRQFGRAKGMFAAFKEEYDKALNDEG